MQLLKEWIGDGVLWAFARRELVLALARLIWECGQYNEADDLFPASV